MKKKSISFYLIIGISLILLIVGVAYAASSITILGNENKINTGIINFNFTESDTGLKIESNGNVSDEDAKISDEYFEFTVSASGTGKVDVGYYIYLTTDSTNNSALNGSIKYYLTSVNGETETPIAGPTLISETIPFNIDTLTYEENSNNRIIHTGYYSFNNDNTLQSTTYRYRMWNYSSSESDGSENNQANIIEDGNGSHQVGLGSATYKVKINVLGVDGKTITITN